MGELVRIEEDGHVRHVVLDRPEKRNAINLDVIRDLYDAVEEVADDGDAYCVVVRGEGKAFSAGIDVSGLADLGGETQSLRPFRRICIDTVNLLEDMAKPTIAQIHGPCLGLGAEISVACDMRVMTEDAIWGLPETRLGLIPDVGGSTRLPALVGLGIAKELVMTGRTIPGLECHRIGLANRVAPAEQLADVTQALVDELLAAAPLAVGNSKQVLNGVARPTVTASLELEGAIQQTLVATEDFREAGMAFMEKRDPSWTGAPPGREASRA
jgi:enoyl-CoA hydratase/carnithine racemase